MAISQGESRNFSPFYQLAGYRCARQSLSVIFETRLWYVIPHFVLETFKYSSIQVGQEGF